MTNAAKKTVLVIGGGAVGAIAALNLDVGGLAEVTIVLRSNYEAVQQSGYDFESCDHGAVKSWKPSIGRRPPLQPSPNSANDPTPSPQHYPQHNRRKHPVI
jgi:ketopantoate reductase